MTSESVTAGVSFLSFGLVGALGRACQGIKSERTVGFRPLPKGLCRVFFGHDPQVAENKLPRWPGWQRQRVLGLAVPDEDIQKDKDDRHRRDSPEKGLHCVSKLATLS